MEIKTELRKHSLEELSTITQKILAERSIDKALYIYSTKILEDRIHHMRSVFPSGTNHAVAIKSNAHPEVLAKIVSLGGGLEAASYEEVLLAVEAGCPYESIVFDSPVKTVKEIQNCASRFPGIIINANCFEELDRLKGLMQVNVGIRINPLLDPGSPGIYNVSSKNSKFGIPISERERIMAYALEMENVKGLHIHAGSEIGNRANHVEAISMIVDVAEEIRNRGKKLDFIDIGGGIPATVDSLEPFFTALVDKNQRIQDYQLITEYGRFVQTHCAFVVSKVEYILDHSDPEIALIHVGADLFPREIYSSAPPKHDFIVLDSEGRLKKTDYKHYDIGGPLCFSGDFLTRNIALPTIEAGDYICITDTGANSLSMWSRHCSREVVEVKMV